MHPSQTQSVSEYLRHEPCPSCGSKNNLARYDDGHGYCFGCTYWEPGDGSDYTPSSKHQMTFMLRGSPEPLPKRRISEEVCKKYRVHREADRLFFHYFTRDGICSGAKVKTKEKTFSWDGQNTDHTLFGQHLFPSHGKRVVITEGELDALSCQEAMPGWPMVSIPDGAKSAKRSIQRQLEWLQGYEEIVLFFDNDDAGREAAKDAASILPPGKCTIARLDDWKDASDALQEGAAQQIREAIWNAKPFRPDGIVEAKSLLDQILTPNDEGLHEYPYKGLQSKLHGIRPGELVTITSGSGMGKSSFCRELAVHLLEKGEHVGYLALEESNRRTALGLMSVAESKPYHIGEHPQAELKEVYTRTLEKWPLYLFDGFGSFEPDIIYNRVEYLAQGLNVKTIFLDHLSILLSGLDGDERRTIDITMTRLRSLVERTGITLFLVCHVSGDDNGKPYEEGGRIKLNKLRGSRSIGQLSDSVVCLERDQQINSATTVRVLKNRFSGEVGIACELTYDLATCKFTEHVPEDEFQPNPDF